MDTNVSEAVPAVVEQTPAAVPVKKATATRTRKPRAPKSGARLSLPPVYNADGSVNAVLETTMERKFQRLELVKGAGKGAVRYNVFSAKELGHISRLVLAVANSWSSGTGSSSDGSTLYVDEHYKRVVEAAPQLRDYILEMETNQGGFNAYRLSFMDAVAQVRQRAMVLKQAEKAFGLKKTKTHRSAKEEPEFTLA